MRGVRSLKQGLDPHGSRTTETAPVSLLRQSATKLPQYLPSKAPPPLSRI